MKGVDSYVTTCDESEDLERKVFIRGDKDVAYGEVVKAMAEITNAGFTKIALVSEPIGTR